MGDIAGTLVRNAAKALVMSWNQRTAEALDKIMPVQSLLIHCSQHSMWFMEKLQVFKRAKRCLERCWRKTRDGSDRICLRAAINAYLMVVREIPKCKKHFKKG